MRLFARSQGKERVTILADSIIAACSPDRLKEHTEALAKLPIAHGLASVQAGELRSRTTLVQRLIPFTKNEDVKLLRSLTSEAWYLTEQYKVRVELLKKDLWSAAGSILPLQLVALAASLERAINGVFATATSSDPSAFATATIHGSGKLRAAHACLMGIITSHFGEQYADCPTIEGLIKPTTSQV